VQGLCAGARRRIRASRFLLKRTPPCRGVLARVIPGNGNRDGTETGTRTVLRLILHEIRKRGRSRAGLPYAGVLPGGPCAPSLASTGLAGARCRPGGRRGHELRRTGSDHGFLVSVRQYGHRAPSRSTRVRCDNHALIRHGLLYRAILCDGPTALPSPAWPHNRYNRTSE
jgi:hypothetical protein